MIDSTKSSRLVNISTDCHPNLGYVDSVQKAVNAKARNSLSLPALGELSLNHVQICPKKGREVLTEDLATDLRAAYPEIRFRLHADVRLSQDRKPLEVDACAYGRNRDYFDKLSDVSKILQADAYTLHVGKKNQSNWANLLRTVDLMEDEMGIPVGIESNHLQGSVTGYWLDEIGDYFNWMKSGRKYAINLGSSQIADGTSMKNSLRTESVFRLVESNQCIEVNLPQLDAESTPWWIPVIDYINPSAVIFYEGNLS